MVIVLTWSPYFDDNIPYLFFTVLCGRTLTSLGYLAISYILITISSYIPDVFVSICSLITIQLNEILCYYETSLVKKSKEKSNQIYIKNDLRRCSKYYGNIRRYE